MIIHNPPEAFELSPTERSSPLWGRLMAHLTARRDTLRARNDGDLDPVVTANTRGRIAECKALLALNDPIDTSLPVENR